MPRICGGAAAPLTAVQVREQIDRLDIASILFSRQGLAERLSTVCKDGGKTTTSELEPGVEREIKSRAGALLEMYRDAAVPLSPVDGM
jgi:hypothetical protein